jgi:hypothetical protein
MPAGSESSFQLVIIFGSTSLMKAGRGFKELREAYPSAQFFGCSTAGEIFGTEVKDDTLVATAVNFEATQIEGTQINIRDFKNSHLMGEHLANSLKKENLVHVIVLSEGLNINGSALVNGLISNLPKNVTVTGGLSGDGERFGETLVLWGDQARNDSIAILGLYGSRLKIGYGSLGGWDPFGPDRLITSSMGNILYELDGKSALELYKKYLGEHAQGLPATGLLFPLSLRTRERQNGIVRTILSVNETDQSMTFAGDVPEGSFARLMKANFDRLIDGSIEAAKTSNQALGSSSADLAILISCVGRKMVLKQRVEEEVEGVRDILGSSTVLAGFYSYGEISPFEPGAKCELHNQTMTITTLSEE